MLGSDKQLKPAFFWQGALILLPVVLLAGVGFFSLRQDKVLAQHEAEDRAQALAETLAPRLWAQLTAAPTPDQLQHEGFEVDAAGELLSPLPYTPEPAPRPLAAASELSPAQLQLWQAARRAEVQGADLAAAIQAYQAFRDSKPSPNFMATAQYALGLLWQRQGQFQQAREMFSSISQQYPQARGETGWPLQPLAEMKLLEMARRRPEALPTSPSALLERICSNAVFHPTPWSAQIFNVLSSGDQARASELVEKWRALWREHESLRELYAAASQQWHTAKTASLLLSAEADMGGSGPNSRSADTPVSSATPDLVWFTMPAGWRSETSAAGLPSPVAPGLGSVPPEGEQQWLALRVETRPGKQWYFVRPDLAVGAALLAAANRTVKLPEYFGLKIELGGREVALPVSDYLQVWHYEGYTSKGAGGERKVFSGERASKVLGSASKSEGGANLLKVNVYLTSPATLFRTQHTRTIWFGLLIGAAAVAALVGLAAAYRAFLRQIRLSQMKSNFVSSVSHELRAPIASVRLMAESLERGKVAEAHKQQEYFRFIVQECRRLSSLIENVLDFARIEQGRKQYEFEPTDLLALTRQTLKLMEPYAAEREVPLVLEVPDHHLSPIDYQLTIDGKAIQQALINLVDNALKHSPKGDTVTVTLQARETQAAPLVTLSVADHGEGIPPAEHEKIFERFYRRGSELRRKTQGVGIGLSIVKHVVEAHGGRVVVRSEVGQGSVFTIQLPVRSELTKAERLTWPSQIQRAAGKSEYRNPKSETNPNS